MRLRIPIFVAALTASLLPVAGCRKWGFPQMPANYREFAYVTNGGGSTVSVLDLVNLRQDRVLQVGKNPGGATANPKRNEVYVVNSGDGTVTVIDAETNTVAVTIGVHAEPYSISVDSEGRMGYVANSGANTVSIIDLAKRREVATIGTGEKPGLAKISPDGRSLVVTNRMSGSVSIYEVPAAPNEDAAYVAPRLRATFDKCTGATDAAILPDSSKVFVACSDGRQVMAIELASAVDSWTRKQDPTSDHDRVLARLDVGLQPIHLNMKPDGGEIFVSNFGSNTITEMSTWTNEVGTTISIGPKPVHGLVTKDNGTLWVATFGGDAVSNYSIDDGKLVGAVRTGPAPDALALSNDEHLLLVADSVSGDVSVIRTEGRDGPGLYTMLPAGEKPNSIAVKAFTLKSLKM